MEKIKFIKDPIHLSGQAIVCGSAKYIGDEIKSTNCLYAKPVFSEKAHAKILKIDYTESLVMPGVRAIFTAKDIPGENQIGHTIKDQPLLAFSEVCYVGQPIAIVVADTYKQALRAAKRVIIEYQDLEPIFTIEEAIKANSFYVEPCTIERGNIEQGFNQSDLIFNGEINTGVQEHMYFETQRSLAIPGDDNNITICSSTQSTSEVQEIVSRILGLRSKDVTVDVKRLGGGFGGKEVGANLWASLAALAAYNLKKPVLLSLTRKEDLSFTGKRHPFRAFYKVGANKDGKILAYDVELCSNGGAYVDISIAILQRSMFHADNAYYIPNVRIVGKACKTNLPPNTAFRGFGAPQGIFAIENVMEDIAHKLNLDPIKVREINFYEEEDEITPFGQKVHEASHKEILKRLLEKSKYISLQKNIEKFNLKNKYVKRGLGFVPVKFGISFTFTALNQGTSLIWIYSDGTISMSHGGIEMGQEVNTKVAQVVARELGIDIEKIRVESSNTQRNGNASPTAASTGADINGNAALDAAKKLRYRLSEIAVNMIKKEIACKTQHFCEINECFDNRAECSNITPAQEYMIFENNYVYDNRYPETKISFDDLVHHAYMNRCNLGAQGYYRTPDIFFDGKKMQGSPFYYFLFGAALVEVEVDILTGMTKLSKVFIAHEGGRSLNKSIDYGQIHGAFFQGFGYCTMEELKWDKDGKYLANTLSTYKIPAYDDLPDIFEIDFIEKDLKYTSVFGSKAIGEPPLIYGEAVYFAIRNALKNALPNKEIKLAMPATPEAILMAISNNIEETE